MADTCNRCHAAITWTKSPKGANLPLDAAPTTQDEAIRINLPVVYMIRAGAEGETPQAVPFLKAEMPSAFMHYANHLHASHFATCPFAAQFSGTRRGSRGRGGRR